MYLNCKRLAFQDGGGNFNGKQQFMSSSATLTVNVVDAQDTPPVFTGTPYFGYVYEISVPVNENCFHTDICSEHKGQPMVLYFFFFSNYAS